jgi:molybdopterin-guanine dinucleotide biosynthesis adapter protein
MKIVGLAGWSGAGKTSLLVDIIELLTVRGLRVSTVKHAHHGFDIDVPGKDSHRHREAGATEVLVSSGRRWALMHELRTEREPGLQHLLRQLSTVDLVIVEGFKREAHPKVEVHRTANGKPYLFPTLTDVRGLITDGARPPEWSGPMASLRDPAEAADLLLRSAAALAEVLARPARSERAALSREPG